MINTQVIPESLIAYAETEDDDRTEWTALVNEAGGGSRTYRWKLDPQQAMGQTDLVHWLDGIIRRHGYPVRIHWRRNGDRGALLHQSTLWGDDDAGASEGGFAAIGNFEGAEIEHEAVTPIERLVKFLVEQPELAANAFRTIMEPFFRRSEQRDAELIKAASAHSAQAAASAAAAAVEQKLAEMATAAGYAVGDDGEIIDDDYYDDDELDDEGNAAALDARADVIEEMTEETDEPVAEPVQAINNTKVVAASESDEHATAEVRA